MSDVANELVGTVRDNEGSVLPGVLVTLSGEESPPREEVTNAEGKYRFGDVKEGRYSLTAHMEGFHPVDCPNIVVHAGENIIDLTMAPAIVEA